MSQPDEAGLAGAGGHVRLEQVTKRYGDVAALEDVSIEVPPGEFITLLGASGSGKSTLLNIVAGFTRASSGGVEVDGKDLTTVPPHRRNLGMVFQDYALFPHMSVFDNVAFPLRRRRYDKGKVRRSVSDALEMVELAAFAERRPSELSGGQRQRVALARAIVYQPPVLLMDEPLGALDRKLREQLQLEIRRLHRDLGTTLIFVTHDQDEALAMSDRIALLRNGSVVQVGAPDELYESPSNVYAAEFVGESNIFRGRANAGTVTAGDLGLAMGDRKARGEVALVVRPEAMRICPPESAPPPGSNALDGVVRDVTYTGATRSLHVRCPGDHELVVRTAGRGEHGAAYRSGDDITVFWEPDAGIVFPDGTASAESEPRIERPSA